MVDSAAVPLPTTPGGEGGIIEAAATSSPGGGGTNAGSTEVGDWMTEFMLARKLSSSGWSLCTGGSRSLSTKGCCSSPPP